MKTKTRKKTEINSVVPKGCSLAPSLNNIYIDKVIMEWKTRLAKLSDFACNRETTTLCADDHVITGGDEDSLNALARKVKCMALNN